MADWKETLRREFCSGGRDVFLIQMRVDLRWDQEAFSRLIQAMQQACQQYDRSETMESWLAEGFFMASTEIRMWTSHATFPREYSEEYYQRAYRRLDDLAYWFFTGDRLYREGHGYEPL